MMTTKPETSLTRELSVKYDFTDNLSFNSTAYRGTISDVLNRSTSTNAYNEIIDISQEGLESSFIINDDNQKLVLSSVFSKSREADGDPQQRRPEKQFGAKYSKKFISDLVGPFSLSYDYRHVGKVETEKWFCSSKSDSSDIMNLSLSKELFGNYWSLNIFNLTDEQYQRPDTYNQEGRKFSLSLRAKY